MGVAARGDERVRAGAVFGVVSGVRCAVWRGGARLVDNGSPVLPSHEASHSRFNLGGGTPAPVVEAGTFVYCDLLGGAPGALVEPALWRSHRRLSGQADALASRSGWNADAWLSRFTPALIYGALDSHELRCAAGALQGRPQLAADLMLFRGSAARLART